MRLVRIIRAVLFHPISGKGLRLAGLAALGCLAPAQAPAVAADSAVIMMYHRFGESDFPSTNITIEQFESHIAELQKGAYTVLPVPDIIAALRAGRRLPDRTVGLTVDDAYLSVYRKAWPRLKKAGFPFTLFVATDSVDRGLAGSMNWDQIRELAAAGVTIGSQTATHLHMPRSSAARNQKDVEASNARFRKELGNPPRLFAYPYGEASLGVAALIKKTGFTAAFGQHSGVMNRADDFYYLPRFAMNENYGSLARFRLAANALPLPVTDFTPPDPTITGENPPAIGFSVIGNIKGLRRLTCYASHEGKVRQERLVDTRIEVRLNKALPKGRTRLNCTMPADGGRWRWLGRQFYVRP
jgi:peptidoglycan/xylan/chitin deacetylase (PgdA/CDA1 family)